MEVLFTVVSRALAVLCCAQCPPQYTVLDNTFTYDLITISCFTEVSHLYHNGNAYVSGITPERENIILGLVRGHCSCCVSRWT